MTLARLSGAILLALLIASGVPANGSSELEILRNPSFEKDTDGNGYPNGWRGTNLTTEDRLVSDAYDGAVAFRLSGTGAAKRFLQNVAGSFPPLTTFHISCFYKVQDPTHGDRFKIIFEVRDLAGIWRAILGGTLDPKARDWTLYEFSQSRSQEFTGVRLEFRVPEGQRGLLFLDLCHLGQQQ